MKRILVIDDEEFLRTAIAQILAGAGYNVFQAADGMQGLEQARTLMPDLIVCDIGMPGLDGLQLIAALRETPATADIPFIFLTGRDDKSDLRIGMQHGADDYLTKPINAQELLRAVELRIKKKEHVLSLGEQKLQELRDSISLSLPHEFRTPLQGILGFAEILMDDSGTLTPEGVREIGQMIREAGLRLHRTSENILAYVQAEILARSPEGLAKLRQQHTSGVPSLLASIAQEKARESHREGDLGLEVNVRRTELLIREEDFRRILEEMLDNSFKFSEPGTKVNVSASESKDTHVIIIRDRGRGMSSEDLARIGAFMQFNRTSFEQQGTGIGLTLAKRLTELYDGAFSVQSEPGKGTAVTIVLKIYSA